jgi:hypothetical protein
MAQEKRTEAFLVRMTPTEVKMFDEVVEHEGVTKSGKFRTWLKNSHSAIKRGKK